MRGGKRAAVLVMLMVVPFAGADGIVSSDPRGDERTLSSAQSFSAQPHALDCHDPSIDVASVALARDIMVRGTYRFHGAHELSGLQCNGVTLAPAERAWKLTIGGPVLFEATAIGTELAPALGCVRAYHMMHGYSVGCVGALEAFPDGFAFEVPREGTVVYADGAHAYSLAGPLLARASAHSKTVIETPLQYVTLYGASDWGEAALSG